MAGTALAARHAAARHELRAGTDRLGAALGLPAPALAESPATTEADRDDERVRIFAFLMAAALAVGRRRLAAR